MVAHRTSHLEHFREFLAQQDISKPLKECMYAGVTEWIASAVDKPKLHAPTRGKLMPAEQMATAAFVEQTSLGWDAFCRGQLSRSWRRAILYSSSVKDEYPTETYLRHIKKKLHSLSLTLWECCNGILHGDTKAAQRELRLALIKDRVKEAYERVLDTRLQVLPRDSSLFTRKQLEERLTGDADTLLCWLRTVEVATRAFENCRTKEIAASETASPLSIEQADFIPSERTDHSRREVEQLESDVSVYTQSQYSDRKKKMAAMDDLQDIILYSTQDSQTIISTEDSLPSPGPFHIKPILDQELSSDSSYTYSRRRDVVLSYDTFTASSAALDTPEGYRASRRQIQIVQMEELQQQMDTLYYSAPGNSDDFSLSALSNESDKETGEFSEPISMVASDQSSATSSLSIISASYLGFVGANRCHLTAFFGSDSSSLSSYSDRSISASSQQLRSSASSGVTA